MERRKAETVHGTARLYSHRQSNHAASLQLSSSGAPYTTATAPYRDVVRDEAAKNNNLSVSIQAQSFAC